MFSHVSYSWLVHFITVFLLLTFELNNAVTWRFLYMFFGTLVQYLCRVYTRSRVAGSFMYMCSNLEDNKKIVFKVVEPMPSTGYEGSYCSSLSPACGINRLFNYSPLGGCLFLIPNVWISSFVKSLLSSPHLFKIFYYWVFNITDL